MFIINPYRFVTGEGPTFAYIGGNTVNGAANTISWPVGTLSGDIALVIVTALPSATVSGMTGFTSVALGTVSTNQVIAYTKVLDSGDISSPPAYSGASAGGYSVVVYRGATAITWKTSVSEDTGNSISITGFSKSASSVRVISTLVDRDPTPAPTTPTGFTGRENERITSFRFAFADIAPDDYTDNAAVTWTGLGTSFNQCGSMFELT